MKRTALFWMAAQLILPPVLPQVTAFALPKNEAPLERFVCNTGYTVEKCHEEITVLRKALTKYPVTQLGNWTWILVRSEDWKPIVRPRGFDPDSPAFTYYLKRETFIEEALVAEVPLRRGELLLKWQMSIANLLDFAIAHELGHALCNEKDEGKANRVARMLQDGRAFACELEAAQGKRR